MKFLPVRDRIAEIVRESLDRGRAVEIEGLGTFRIRGGRHQFTPQKGAQVFIAYAAEDLPHASRLCDALRKQGCVLLVCGGRESIVRKSKAMLE